MAVVIEAVEEQWGSVFKEAVEPGKHRFLPGKNQCWSECLVYGFNPGRQTTVNMRAYPFRRMLPGRETLRKTEVHLRHNAYNSRNNDSSQKGRNARIITIREKQKGIVFNASHTSTFLLLGSLSKIENFRSVKTTFMYSLTFLEAETLKSL